MPTLTTEQALDLAVEHHRAGRLEKAEQLYRAILARLPDHPDAISNLGVIAQQTGRSDLAVQLLRQAIGLKPDFADAYANLAVVLRARGEFKEAVAALRQLVALQPNNAEANNNLGLALAALGRLEESIAAHHRAIAINPKLVEAHRCLGIALQANGQLDDAVAAYRQTISLAPEYADAHNNLGNALREKGLTDEAIAAYRRALELNSNFPEAMVNLGNVLKDQGLLDEAIAACRQAIALRPDYPEASSNLLFTLHFHPAYDARVISEEHSRWNRQYAQPLKNQIRPHANDRDPVRPLRIGYVSPDFRDHCQAFFTAPLFSHHDRRNFQIVAYADIGRSDAVSKWLEERTDLWRGTVNLPDVQLADRIREDRIDILVDLTMHMAHNRLLAFARKPAPVQISWLAYPGSTGLSAIDYRLSDPQLDPPGMDESVYGEQTIRLPETFWCYNPLNTQAQPGPLPAISSGRLTFGSLNNFCKINPRTLELWAPVLEAVTDSELILLSPHGRHRQNVLDFFSRRGIDAGRIRFVEFQPRQKYLEVFNRVDIGLDTLPYNGHTTSLDAMWMGVPVVTRVGDTVVGRAGLSQLSNVGLTDLAGKTDEEFVSIAVNLANDLPRLSQLRLTLRQRMTESPLMDAPRFARNLEVVYRRIWQRWCKSGR